MNNSQYDPFGSGDTNSFNKESFVNYRDENNNKQYNPYYNQQANNNYNQYNNAYGQSMPVNEQIERNKQQYYINKQMLNMQKKELRRFGNSIGLASISYVLISIIASSVLLLLGNNLYSTNPVFQYSFNLLLTVCAVALPFGIMAIVNKKRYALPIVPSNKVGGKDLTLWVSFGMLCCVGSNIIVTLGVVPFFKTFGYELSQSESLDPNSPFACIMTLISVAVAPAVCEEFALRCCAQQLIRKYGKAFAVFSVSIVFSLMHGNVIQFVFTFLIALIMGYVTVKTDSILPAILIHAFNNGMSAMNSTATYFMGEKNSEYTLSIFFVFWICAGTAALIYMLKNQYFKKERKMKNPAKVELTSWQKISSFFFAPGMIIPVILFVIMIIQSIQKA